MIKRNKCFLKILCFSFLLLGINSCQLFENDVADFFEKYTETAAIETHNISVNTYNDTLSQLCIASEEDAEIEMFMRNPKKFNLVPSVIFNNLSEQINRSSVDISQTDINTIKLLLPQEFLILSDEGQDITAEINLYEPMSGRSFDRYKISLNCNTKPPVILNPTVINNSNSTFVVAFDMPSPEEVAIRHKDISAVEINGQSYPVTVTTRADPDVEGAYIAEYTIDDPHFTRTASAGYTFIGGKEFTAKSATSFYYDTGDSFFAGNKEYTVVLKDKAGLTSTVKASTSISKLNKPVLKDQGGALISENGITGIPFDEETMTGKISIEPPVKDHLGNDVSGATVYYKVYEATGNGRVYTSGITTEAITIELPQNTYRVEAYATLTNYENSSTTTVRFRFVNNILYVRADFENGDGSEGAPYATIQQAIDDINARPRHETRFTIYAEDNGTIKLNEEIVLSGNVNTDIFTITKKPGAVSATIKSLKLEADLPSEFNFTASGITVSGSSAEGICLNAASPVTLEDITVTDSGTTGLKVTAGTVSLNKGTISGAGGKGISYTGGSLTLNDVDISDSGADGIEVTAGSLVYDKGSISNNGGNGINVSGGSLTYKAGSISRNTENGINFSGSALTYTSGTISGNTLHGINLSAGSLTYTDGTISGNSENGINLSGGSIIYTTGTIKENTKDGINISGGIVTYKDGTISSNGKNGINVSGAANTLMLNFEKGCIKSNGKHGIQLTDAKIEIKEGLISSNTDHGIYANEGIVDLYAVTVSENENGIFSTGTVNLNEGNPTITANRGYGIKNFGGSINIYDGSITDNEDSGIITTNGLFGVTCNLYGGSITGNKNGGLTKTSSAYVTNTNWNVKGAPVVYNNTSGSGASLKKYNIVLTGNQLLTVKGQLTNGCLLGITTDAAKEPIALGDTYSFTEGYDQFNTDSPSNYFKSDRGFAIIADDSGSEIQAAIAMTGAQGNTSYTAYDYLFTFSENNQQTYIALPDTARSDIEIDYLVYRQEPPDPDYPADPPSKTRLYTGRDDGKLYSNNPGQYIDPSSEAGATLELSAALYNGDIKLMDLECYPYYDKVTIIVPGLPNDDVYTIRLTISYLGLSHVTERTYKVVSPRQEFTSAIEVLPAGTDGSAGTSATYVLFGDYPQSVVPSTSTLYVDESVKNDAGYCLGDDGCWYVKVYEDKYSSTSVTYSDGSAPRTYGGYENWRYFKVEPLKWRVISKNFDHDLDAETEGKWFLISEHTLKPSSFWYSDQNGPLVDNSRKNSSMYKYSNLRAWLNGLKYYSDRGSEVDGYYNKGFLQEAFTEAAQNLILTTKVDNSRSSGQDAAETFTPPAEGYFSENTDDKIFILSQREATSPEYGFQGRNIEDDARTFTATDYAIASGMYVGDDGVGSWWLRSPASASDSPRTSVLQGSLYKKTSASAASHCKFYGVLPALCIDPQ